MRDLKPFGKHHADLCVSLVVGLQSGQHQIETLVAHGRRERGRRDGRVGAGKRVVLDVNRPVRTARERFPDDLLHTRRTGAADHDFPAVLLAQAQRFFQRVRVRLVQLVAGILLTNPRARVVQARLPLAGGHLLDADGNLHC